MTAIAPAQRAGPTAPAADRKARRLQRLVVAVIVLGVASVIGSLLAPGAWDHPPPELWRVALAAAAILIGDLTFLHLRFGHDQHSFTWQDASILVGLVLLPRPWLVIVAPACMALAHLVRRRPALKIAFNSMMIATGVTLARAVSEAVAQGAPLDRGGLRVWAGLAAAAVVYFLWNTATVAAAVAFSQDLPFRIVLRKGAILNIAILLGNCVTAFALITTEWHGGTLVSVPAFIVLLYLAYRGYLRAMEERDVWQQLEATSKELSQLDESGVAAAALVRAAQLFKADTVELALLGTGAGVSDRVFTGDATGLHHVAEVPEAGDRSDGKEFLAGADGQLLTLGGRGDNTFVVAPLDGLRGVMGTLRIGFRGPVQLTSRERQVLGTYAHTVSTSVQNARLYEDVRAQAAISAHEASHDMLTGLANRSLVQDRAARALADAAANGTACALLFIDLDHFKEINDTLGHSAGDVLLCTVAERLTEAVRSSDTVARLGGDEFAVLLPEIASPKAADAVAAQLLGVLAEPVSFEGLRLSIEGSIGVACYPTDGRTSEELFRRADVAMYQAKGSRGSFQHYRSDKDDSSVTRLALMAELRSALDNDELLLHFQPQVELGSQEVVGVEVLTRWMHPRRGLLPPSDFVAAAEQSGLVREFTLHILERAVAECAQWQRPGRALTVAVNLSARNLLDRQLPADVTEVLQRYDFPPHLLVLEITETTMMSELEVVEEVLSGLRRVGVQLSVDDFGTGYSSLAFLQRVAVNEIKVDRSFVRGMLCSDSDMTIVRATIDLAHGLGLRVVAEGVETQELLLALTDLSCDIAQGYHLGRPVDAGDTQHALGLAAIAPVTSIATARLAARAAPRRVKAAD